MEEKAAEEERDGYSIRIVFKYAKEIFKKLTTNTLTMIMSVFVDFFFIALCSPFWSIDRSFKKHPQKSLPILRLRFLAIQEVFKAMGPIEM
ncbi:hypothetical protein CRE_15131 [Caenorhabditis remanei]|uniref:Uncharacterized protein n=1 Tax=Caenorhabditis remanei TaxID=31234 RepID=E3NRI4_CAERE|nr:hypothetical protein CRE_15131 [Caenorhabditis remanei]